jgi:PAS domain S-box-containing protein
VNPAYLLDLAYDPIFAFGLDDGRITLWNRASEELYGWTADEAIGRQPDELLNTVHESSRDAIFEQLFRDGRWQGHLVQTRRDGTRMMVEARWALVADDAGGVILEINRDVTAAHALAESARRLDRAKAEFIESVAHQLRTPVTVINGYLELIREGRLEAGPAQIQAALATISRSAHELSDLVERIVAAARIESSPGDVHIQHCNFTEIVAAAGAESEARAPGARVAVTAPPSLVVAADPVKLRAVVRNLLATVLDAAADGLVECRLEANSGAARLTIEHPASPGGPPVVISDVTLQLAAHLARLQGAELAWRISDGSSQLQLAVPLAA